jgi:phage baseplate assembly protein gpV
MKPLLVMERRLQDLERRLENMSRVGKVTDVKFDTEKKRWFVKMEDGDTDKRTFKTDWLPWKSFSHGSISASIPPRKGMAVELRSPNGYPEMGAVEPYHYNPDNPSPHDKEDEVFIKVKKPAAEGEGASAQDTPDETITFHATKDGTTIKIGSTTIHVTKDTVQIDTKNTIINAADAITLKTKAYAVECETHNIKANTFTAQTGQVNWSQS